MFKQSFTIGSIAAVAQPLLFSFLIILLSTPQERTPGRYDFDADVGMAGQWTMTVTFDPNGRVQFALRAQ
jgi:hypothetical protein